MDSSSSFNKKTGIIEEDTTTTEFQERNITTMRSEIIQQRILQQNTEEESSSGPNTDPTVWFLVWIGALFLILMCPFLTNKRIRRLCYRRIVQRNRGNNDEEEEDGGDTFLPRARIVRSVYNTPGVLVHGLRNSQNSVLLEELLALSKILFVPICFVQI